MALTRARKPKQPAGSRQRLRWFAAIVCIVACFGWLWCGAARAGDAAEEFRVIVHPDNPAASVPREFLADVFLKKITRWDDGESARPVDQLPTAAVRQRFSERVLKRPVAAIRSYWQQRIFSGRALPPPELDSDEAVVSYVLKERGAVGYVSGSAQLARVKVLSIR